VEPGWGPPNSPGNDLCRSLFEHGGGAWLAEAGDRIRLKFGRFNYVSDNPPWNLVLTDTILCRARLNPRLQCLEDRPSAMWSGFWRRDGAAVLWQDWSTRAHDPRTHLRV
jgi:hypothetical protein